MLPMLMIVATLSGGPRDDCRYSAERTADVSAAGLSSLDLEAGAGELRIVGRTDISEIRVRGHACASSRGALDGLQIQATRSGGRYHVKTLPDNSRNTDDEEYARIDLVIEMPARLAAIVDDGSGDAHIEGVASLDITDGSGELEIANIGGIVRVDDGSGELTISDVQGDVEIEDGSGEITIRDVHGSVTVRDGSGSIDVTRIGGDFTVTADGSGEIHQRGVSGTVRLPSRRRDGID